MNYGFFGADMAWEITKALLRGLKTTADIGIAAKREIDEKREIDAKDLADKKQKLAEFSSTLSRQEIEEWLRTLSKEELAEVARILNSD